MLDAWSPQLECSSDMRGEKWPALHAAARAGDQGTDRAAFYAQILTFT